MNLIDQQATDAEIAQLLAQSPFAGQLRDAAFLLVAAQDPTVVIFANKAARAVFGASSLEQLNSVAVAGGSPGARRLRQLASAATIGAPPRLELLRFYIGRRPILQALLCASVADANGRALFVAAAPAAFTDASQRAERTASEHPPLDFSNASRGQVEARTRARRFLWSVNQDLSFAAPTRALADAVGGAAPQMRESLEALKARTGLDQGGEFAEALARRTTFGSVRLAWPREAPQGSDDEAVIVVLSGAPIFDRDRRFLGYRGFGVFTGETAAFPAKDEETPEGENSSHSSGPDLSNKAAPLSFPPHTQAVQSEPPPTESPAIASQAPIERSAEIVPLRAPSQSYAGGPNVVPIRPGANRNFAPVDEEPRRDEDAESVELTTHERDAFREIARALGAKVKDRAQPEGNDRNSSAPVSLDETRDLIDVSDSSAPTMQDTASAHSIDSRHRDVSDLLNRLPIGVLVMRGEEALYLNQTLLDLLGYQDLSQFRASAGLAHAFKGRHLEQIGAAGESSTLSILTADGESIAVDGQVETIEWGGAPASLVSLRRSLEAEFGPRLKALETDAQAADRKALELATVLDTATDGVVMLDSQGAILALNRPAEALFGFDQKEVAGQSVLTLLAPESREPIKAYFDGLRTSGLASLLNDGREALGRERHGRAIPLFITMGRVNSSPDAKFCAVLRDMTQWKTIERDLDAARGQAEKANALKSEFLAKISHEIRTPLNAILGFAEVIMDERFGPVGNERYKEYLKDIHASGAHVMSLVNDLLDLSKIEAGKLEFNFAAVDANTVIQECVSLMQPQAAQERIIMRLSLFDKLPRIIADERSLRQIMLNLMSNAVKFNEPGGQVIVSTAMNDSGQAVIRVRDTGIGMNDAELGTAMEPFRQISSPRQKGGTGLGLPLTKALVEANRAGISIKSRKEQGTLVEVAFPTAQAAAAQ
jgi:PAS domain S-box-containing protein